MSAMHLDLRAEQSNLPLRVNQEITVASLGDVCMALLDVRNVSKNFGAIQAVNDISFSVEPGEVVGLMGDNGAGKSTMVKLVAGNFPPSEGEIAVDDQICHFYKPI